MLSSATPSLPRSHSGNCYSKERDLVPHMIIVVLGVGGIDDPLRLRYHLDFPVVEKLPQRLRCLYPVIEPVVVRTSLDLTTGFRSDHA